MEKQWVLERCREVQRAPNGYLDLWAREHFKSSIITCGLTVQNILEDPEITACIFSHTRPAAKAHLRVIKQALETNEVLKLTFPDVLWEKPDRQAPMWSEDSGIVVKRRTNPKEATLEASGLVDGQPTGKHFKLRIYDDVVTRESVTTAEQIKKTTDAWELSDNLGAVGGFVRTIGTRYNLHDTYSAMISRKAARPRIYAATSNGQIDGTPVLFTPEEWERRKKVQSRQMIAAQLLQNPLADEDASFRPQWLRSCEVYPRTLNVSITCDPSLGRSATSDNTAIAVVGHAAGNTRYLLDGACHRMGLSERWRRLRDFQLKWSSRPGVLNVKVGYERYGQQSDGDYFNERQREEFKHTPHRMFQIEELNWAREGGQSKRDRVERLEPDFRNGRFFLPSVVWHEGKPHWWEIDTDRDSPVYGTVQYKLVEGLSKAQIAAIAAGSDDLVTRPIKQVDSDGRIYDLAQKFIAEYISFPFGQYKDLIDATSRYVDLEMLPPVIHSKQSLEPRIYHDS